MQIFLEICRFRSILGSLGGALGRYFGCFLDGKFWSDFWSHFGGRGGGPALAAVRHFMACTGVAGPDLARPRPQGGGRIEDADARPPHLKGGRALGLLSVSAGFWLDSGWTLQLLPRRRQDPAMQETFVFFEKY